MTILSVVHLDQLYHLPDTNWISFESAEFIRQHSLAVNQRRWVMEGNYTKCIDERLVRAKGMILLNVSVTVGLVRYIRRSYSSAPRPGAEIGQGECQMEDDKVHNKCCPIKPLAAQGALRSYYTAEVAAEIPTRGEGMLKKWDLGGDEFHCRHSPFGCLTQSYPENKRIMLLTKQHVIVTGLITI